MFCKHTNCVAVLSVIFLANVKLEEQLDLFTAVGSCWSKTSVATVTQNRGEHTHTQSKGHKSLLTACQNTQMTVSLHHTETPDYLKTMLDCS